MTGLNTWGLNSPAIGSAASGYEPLGDTYSLEEPLVLANSTCIIGTDNGFVIKRTSPNHFKVVYADSYNPDANIDNLCHGCPDQGIGPHSYRSLQCEDINVCWNNPDIIVVHVEDEEVSGAWGGYVVSTDRGESFQFNNPSPPATYPPLAYGYGDTLGAEGISMDESGLLWAYRFKGGLPNSDWYTSPDAANWTDRFAGDPSLAGGRTHFIADGYIWGIALFQNITTPLKLYRQSTSGGSVIQTTITKPGSSTFGSIGVLWGRPTVTRLIGWQSVLRQQSGSAGWNFLSIDIANPLAPTYQWSATGLPEVNYNVMMVIPLTRDVVVCNTLNSIDSRDGAIWRSADAGMTWTKVVDHTTRLGLASPVSGLGISRLNEDNQRMASPPGMNWELWAATKPPYVYHSRDMGLTWEVESVDMSIFDGYPGRLPTVWTSIGAIPLDIEPPNLVTTA